MTHFEHSLRRNIIETYHAIYNRRAIDELARAEATLTTNLTFFRLAQMALYNDMIAHAAKVLDKNKDSATFWYIYDQRRNEVDRFVASIDRELKILQDISSNLKHVRDKTHFHIDRKSVLSPNAVWQKAGITGNDFVEALDLLENILQHLWRLEKGEDFPIVPYDATDIKDIVEVSRQAGILPRNYA